MHPYLDEATQQRIIAAEEDYIRRNIAGQNSKQAKGRRKRLERLPRLSAPIADADAETKQQQGLLWFADCIVKRDRPAANDVIVRQVGSRAQDEAYARLMPDLGPCLPQGQQVKFSKPILEGVLAEALYRAPAAASSMTHANVPASIFMRRANRTAVVGPSAIW